MLSPTTSAAATSRAPPPESAEARHGGPAAPRRHRLPSMATRFAPVIAFAAGLALWEFSCRFFAVPAFLLPAPSLIVTGALEQTLPIWLGHPCATLRVAIMGYI